MRVRGLKPEPCPECKPHAHVAPRAGAWVETAATRAYGVAVAGAPRAGAWVETSSNGLPIEASDVAPRAGAWVETVAGKPFFHCSMSHPVRVRGLKHS